MGRETSFCTCSRIRSTSCHEEQITQTHISVVYYTVKPKLIQTPSTFMKWSQFIRSSLESGNKIYQESRVTLPQNSPNIKYSQGYGTNTNSISMICYYCDFSNILCGFQRWMKIVICCSLYYNIVNKPASVISSIINRDGLYRDDTLHIIIL